MHDTAAAAADDDNDDDNNGDKYLHCRLTDISLFMLTAVSLMESNRVEPRK